MAIIILLVCGIIITDDDTGPLCTAIAFLCGIICIVAILNGKINFFM